MRASGFCTGRPSGTVTAAGAARPRDIEGGLRLGDHGFERFAARGVKNLLLVGSPEEDHVPFQREHVVRSSKLVGTRVCTPDS